MLLKHGTFIKNCGTYKPRAKQFAAQCNETIREKGKDDEFQAVVLMSLLGENPRTGDKIKTYAVYVRATAEGELEGEIDNEAAVSTVPAYRSEAGRV